MVDLKDLIKIQKNKCLESKRARYSQNFKFNYNRNRNLIISLLTQISRTIHLIWDLLFQNQQWKRQNNYGICLMLTTIKTPERGQ